MAEPLSGRTGPRPGGELPRIAGYDVLGVIGRGASGVVYRARQLAVDREVALKVLHAELSGSPRVVQRLQREARTSARLAHPHVVSAIDMGSTGGRWWYAMELVDGPSLATVLRRDGRLSEREALRLFVPLCEALVHLWEHGVVHRDVKPANILIDRAGGARLADLGLAFADDDPRLTGHGGTVGTPHYVSPEQAIDPGAADVRSDLWSFGATLYHAVCGRPPFAGESTAEVLSGVLYAAIPDPRELEPSLSKGLALVLRKCLVRDPEERYQTPRELLADLERVRERRAPRVRVRSLDPPAGRADRRRRVALGLAAAAVAAAALAWGATRLGEPPEEEGAALASEPTVHPPLEAVAQRAAVLPERFGEHLRELERIEPGVPEAARPRLEELRDRLAARLRDAAEAALSEVADEVDARLAAGDLVGARALVADALPLRLEARTGFTAAELEERAGWTRSRRVALEAAVRTTEAELAGALRARVETRTAELLEEATRLRAAGRWRSAREVLAVSEEELLAEAGLAGYRFPADVREDVLGQALVRLGVARQDAGFAWREVDLELRDWIASRARTLRERLAAGEDVVAADALRRAYEEELFRRRIDAEEAALDHSRLALDLLRREVDTLDELEDAAREERMRAEHDLNEELARELWTDRAYGKVEALWRGFLGELAEAPGEPDRPWRAELARRAELRIQEARRLAGLLERVAERVATLDGARRRLAVLRSGIAVEGRLEAGADPLADGFRLVPDEGEPFRLDLRTMRRQDLEGLAGLAELDEDLRPEERLTAALLRYREDGPHRAEQTLASGPTPEDDASAALADDLRRRVAAGVERLRRQRESRAAEAQRWIEIALSDERADRAPEQVLLAVERLLRDHADVPSVRLLRDELLARRRDLLRERGLEEAYGPDRIEELRGGRVRMTFLFDGPEAGAWERGTWRPDGAAWSAPETARSWDDLARRFGPRLALRPPLETDHDLAATLRFRIPDPQAPPQLLLVSFAGFHLALTGPGLPGAGPTERWHASAGDLTPFLDDLRTGSGTPAANLLRPGEHQTLHLRADPARGTLKIDLDGRPLGELRTARLGPDASRTLTLRSWEPVRVTEVVVEGERE